MYDEKNKRLLLTKALYSLTIVWTIITCIIVYNNIDNNMASKFVIGYALFVLLMLIYVPIITLFNAKTLKWIILKKILKQFIFLFALSFLLRCAFNYIFKNSNINILDAITHSLALAFSIAFINVTFLRR